MSPTTRGLTRTNSSLTILSIEGDDESSKGVIDNLLAVGTTDASGFWTTGYGTGQMENGSMTLLLVETFTGSVSDDLDTNDDGVFDVTPWTSIVDGVAVDDGDGSDLTYATPALAPNFDGGIFSVGGASRVPDGTDTDGTGDWVRNDFDGDGLPCCAGAVADPGEAINTLGASNVVATALPDVVINEVDAESALPERFGWSAQHRHLHPGCSHARC